MNKIGLYCLISAMATGLSALDSSSLEFSGEVINTILSEADDSPQLTPPEPSADSLSPAVATFFPQYEPWANFEGSHKSRENQTSHSTTNTPYFTFVDARVAAFFPQSERFREIYGNVGPAYEIQVATELTRHCEFWANFGWFHKSSKDQRKCCRSTINIPDLTFGVNYLWSPYARLDLYLGIGPALGMVILNDHSCCGNQKKSRFAAGGVLKGGLRWNFYSLMFFEIFTDYLYQPAFFKRAINIGGTKVGGGFGVKF